MSVMLISNKKKFFMSGDINLRPGQTLVVDENILTERQLIDIIFNIEIGDLISEDLGKLQSRLSQISSNNGGGGNSGTDPITLKRVGILETELAELKKLIATLSNPTHTTIRIREDLMWTTTHW